MDVIGQEVAREVEQLPRTIFTGIGKKGHVDLEAVKMLVRSAMHQAGAAALTELLRFPEPEQRTIPCPCGWQARSRELRSKPVLTVAGKVEVSRPWYLCPRCHQGQFPADAELEVPSWAPLVVPELRFPRLMPQGDYGDQRRAKQQESRRLGDVREVDIVDSSSDVASAERQRRCHGPRGDRRDAQQRGAAVRHAGDRGE